jgi:hypothetical protein
MLPAEVKRQAESEARRLKVSFADFVREAISEKLPQNRGGADRLKRRRQDPLLRLLDHLPAARQTAATDVAANHHDYLYGGKSSFHGP